MLLQRRWDALCFGRGFCSHLKCAVIVKKGDACFGMQAGQTSVLGSGPGDADAKDLALEFVGGSSFGFQHTCCRNRGLDSSSLIPDPEQAPVIQEEAWLGFKLGS